MEGSLETGEPESEDMVGSAETVESAGATGEILEGELFLVKVSARLTRARECDERTLLRLQEEKAASERLKAACLVAEEPTNHYGRRGSSPSVDQRQGLGN